MTAKIGVNLITTLTGHKQSVFALCKAGETSFYSAGGDGYLVHWDYLSGADGIAKVQIPETVFALCCLPDGTLLAGAQSGALYVVMPGEEPRKLVAHEKGIYSVNILDDNLILTTGGDGFVILWNREFEVIKKVQISEKPVRSFAQLSGLGVYAFGSSDWKIYITNAGLKILEILDGHTQSVFALAYFSKDQILFSGGRDAVMRSWDLNSVKQLDPIAAHWFHIHSLKLNPAGNLLASGSMDKTLKLWDPNNSELLKVVDIPKFNAHKSSVNTLLWLNDNTLVSGSDDKTLKVWEITKEA